MSHTLITNFEDGDDLVTGILGIQVDSRAKTVRWTNGQRTVLPFLRKPNRNRNIAQNLLANDARYAAELATLPEAAPNSSLVAYLDKAHDKFDLYEAARQALASNKSVVIKGYVDTSGFQFNTVDLQKHYGVIPDRPVQAHGKLSISSSLTGTHMAHLFRYGRARQKFQQAPCPHHGGKVRAGYHRQKGMQGYARVSPPSIQRSFPIRVSFLYLFPD